MKSVNGLDSISYSRVSMFGICPAKFRYKYIDELVHLPTDDPKDPLKLGTALHTTLEKGFSEGEREYYNSYFHITDDHISEMIKVELVAKDVELPDGEYEVEIKSGKFIGYIDLVSPNDDGTVDIYDFKYSNNIKAYYHSGQLHIYKFYYEKIFKKKVKNLYYLFFPKSHIRQKKNESLEEYRYRIVSELSGKQIIKVKIYYDPNRIKQYFNLIDEIEKTTNYPKREKPHCKWCEYKEYCLEGDDTMLLPKNEKKQIEITKNPHMWIYADSYVGKSTFVDNFPNLLFLNTDGNTQNIRSPYISLKDNVEKEGRMIKRKSAWELFLDILTELELKDNDFKTIAIDLIEDLYEHCRIYVFDREGWIHESDGNYGKGWSVVWTEFVSAIKRFKNAGYQIIYISKEKVTEIKHKSYTETKYQPNINDRISNALAGTVSMTIRAYMDGDKRFLQLKKLDNCFGGSRFNWTKDEIPLDFDKFMKVLHDSQGTIEDSIKPKKVDKDKSEDKNDDAWQPQDTRYTDPDGEDVAERSKTKKEENKNDDEKPQKTRRRRRAISE